MRTLALALALLSVMAAAPALACDPDDDPEDCVRPLPRTMRQLPPAPLQRRMQAPQRREVAPKPSRVEVPTQLSPPGGGEGKPVSAERTSDERTADERKPGERKVERKSSCRQYSPTIGRTIEVACE